MGALFGVSERLGSSTDRLAGVVETGDTKRIDGGLNRGLDEGYVEEEGIVVNELKGVHLVGVAVLEVSHRPAKKDHSINPNCKCTSLTCA